MYTSAVESAKTSRWPNGLLQMSVRQWRKASSFPIRRGTLNSCAIVVTSCTSEKKTICCASMTFYERRTQKTGGADGARRNPGWHDRRPGQWLHGIDLYSRTWEGQPEGSRYSNFRRVAADCRRSRCAAHVVRGAHGDR